MKCQYSNYGVNLLGTITISNKSLFKTDLPLNISRFWWHNNFFFNGSTAPWKPRPPHFSSLHDHTPHSVGLLWTRDQLVAETSTWQHTTLTTDRHPCHPAGFEPTIPVSERPQTHALDRTATGYRRHNNSNNNNNNNEIWMGCLDSIQYCFKWRAF
jgi:hypothetical protein